MQKDALAASCLCGSVRFEISPPFSGFRYCHCSRCRKATGAAHAANIFLPQSQLKWLAGESLIKRFDLPGAKRFAVCFCTQCGTRVPHKIPGTENYLVPAGILDASPDARPEGSIFWGSRAPWYVETQALPKHDEYAK
jgi:hypothetical protein